jgi:hypothetical protein
MNNYIVRIYRHKEDDPQSLFGVVEDVESNGREPFHSYDDLWKILNRAKKRGPGRGKKKGNPLGDMEK